MQSIPIAYELDAVTSIRRHKNTHPLHKHKPPVWHIVRDLAPHDSSLIGVHHDRIRQWMASGWKSLYWTGNRWWIEGRFDFATAEDAEREWLEKVRDYAGNQWVEQDWCAGVRGSL